MSQTKQSANQFMQFSLLDAAEEYTTELRWIASEVFRLQHTFGGTSKLIQQLSILKPHFVQLVGMAEDLARHLSAMVEHALPSPEETPDIFVWKLRLSALEQAIESARAATGGDK